MDIRIKTQPSSEVMDHDDVSQFLKYEDDQTAENTLIDDMISEVRAHFEKVTGLSLVSKTYVVYFKHEDSPFVLPVSPVISVTSVTTVDNEGDEDALTLNTDYYKKGMYEVEIICDAGSISNPLRNVSGKYDLKVEFTAGYGHDDTETLPKDIEGAIKKQVKQWYDNRDDFFEAKMLGSIQNVLNKYKTSFF